MLNFCYLIILSLFFCEMTTTQVYASHLVNDKYIVFDSREEAIAWLKKNKPELAANILPFEHLIYERPLRILGSIWGSYQDLYPDRSSKLPIPELVIVDYPYVDGSTLTEDSTEHIPAIFQISKPAAETTHNSIAGLMAHELTHYLFPDFQPVYYQKKGKTEPLGYNQENELQAELVVKEWTKLTKNVGPFVLDELNGLPFQFINDGQLSYFLTAGARKYGDPLKPSCVRASTSEVEWNIYFIKHYISFVDFSLKLEADQRQNIRSKTEAYIGDLRDCLKNRKVDFLDLAMTVTGWSQDQVKQRYVGEAAIFQNYSDAVDGFMALTKVSYTRMKEMLIQYDLASYRTYSYEEIADDNSVRILFHLGWNPNGLREFIEAAGESYQAGFKKNCFEILNRGEVPGYGLLSDPHHGACYRIFHIEEISRRVIGRSEPFFPSQAADIGR